MKTYIKVLTAIAAVTAVCAAISKYLCDYALAKKGGFIINHKANAKNDEQLRIAELMQSRREEYADFMAENSEDIYLLTKDSVKVHALYIPSESFSRKYVVICHGYKDSAESMSYQAYKFHKMGYNVLAPDGRAAGKNSGNYLGMGWLEHKDLCGYINYIISRDTGAEILLYGISMGAAEVMMAAGEQLPDNVKAVIEDCGYTSVWDVFELQLKKLFGLPAFPLLYMASAYSKLFLGFGFKEASAENALRRSKLPILFIHGTEDDFVPFSMLDRLYNAANGEKQKLVIEGAKHYQSDVAEPELYWSTVEEFAGKYIK